MRKPRRDTPDTIAHFGEWVQVEGLLDDYRSHLIAADLQVVKLSFDQAHLLLKTPHCRGVLSYIPQIVAIPYSDGITCAKKSGYLAIWLSELERINQPVHLVIFPISLSYVAGLKLSRLNLITARNGKLQYLRYRLTRSPLILLQNAGGEYLPA